MVLSNMDDPTFKISRSTAYALSKLFGACFATGTNGTKDKLKRQDLNDFLFLNNFEITFVDDLIASFNQYSKIDALERFIIRLFIGDGLVEISSDERNQYASPYELKQRSQTLLWMLLESILQDKDHLYYASVKEYRSRLINSLALDGFVFVNGTLHRQEQPIFDVPEQMGILEQLYSELKLGQNAQAVAALKLSEQHYISGLWSDSISNARKFLECVLQEIVASISLQKGELINDKIKANATLIRQHLLEYGIITAKQQEALGKLYGMLSDTGSHPYIADKDEARLSRYLSLSLAEYVMLEFQGYLGTINKIP